MMAEFICEKCGQVFIDVETETTHYARLDEDDNLVDCGGRGKIVATFPKSSIPPNAG